MKDTKPSRKLRKGQPSSSTSKPDNINTVKHMQKLKKKSIPSHLRPIIPAVTNICHLPEELLLTILESCLILKDPVLAKVKKTLHRKQTSTLNNICRTCRTFYRIALPLLYNAPTPYNKLFQTLVQRPDLAEHVKVIDLGSWDHVLFHSPLAGPFAYSDANQHLKVVIQHLKTPDEWAWKLLGRPWRKLYVHNFATLVFSEQGMQKIFHLLNSVDFKKSLACLLAASTLLHATNMSPGRCLFPNIQSISISSPTLCLFPMILTSPTLKTIHVHTWSLPNFPWGYSNLIFPSGTSGVENIIISHFTCNEKLLAKLIACSAKLLTFEMTVEVPDSMLADSDVWMVTGRSLFLHRQHLRRVILHCPRLSELKRRESKRTPHVRKPIGLPRLCKFVSLEHLEIQYPVLMGPHVILSDDGVRLPAILPPSLRKLVLSDVVNGLFGQLKILEMEQARCCPILRLLEIRTLYSLDTFGRRGPTPQSWRAGQPIEVMDQEKLQQKFRDKGVNFFWSQPEGKPLKRRFSSIIQWCVAKKENLDL